MLTHSSDPNAQEGGTSSSGGGGDTAADSILGKPENIEPEASASGGAGGDATSPAPAPTTAAEDALPQQMSAQVRLGPQPSDVLAHPTSRLLRHPS